MRTNLRNWATRKNIRVGSGVQRTPSRRTANPNNGVPAWVWAVIGAGGLMFLCCGGGVALLAFRAATEELATYTPVTADQLIDEWKANPAAAAKKYERNGVELTGKLKEIDSNIHGQTYIDVRGQRDDWDRGTHIFVICAKAKDGLAKCRVGDMVVVKARADGSTQNRPWLVADEISPR
ncbi:hypothetical protein J0H58_32160 [bacterium]|nr:hypothetical protein [bacterium]